jgi:hypothetical protein
MGVNPVVNPSGFDTFRRWPRYRLDIPVRLVVDKVNKTAIVQGRGNELNEGGLTLFAGIELVPDEHIAVEFTPPYAGGPIRARCVVRNREHYRYGVEFLMENQEDHDNAERIRGVLRGYGVPIH